MKKYFAIILLFLPLCAISAQQKYALVIGNSEYKNVTKLANPANNANDIKNTLQSLGFKVDLLTNATNEKMEDAAIRFKQNLNRDKNSYGFFFYAGHGVQAQGQNYLVPVDADIKSESFLKSKAFNVQTLLDELEEAGNELNVIVLDACRDNPFGWSRSGTRGLAVVSAAPAGSILVYATSAGKTAADGTGRNGLFTGELLKNLSAEIEIKEVFNRTGRDVLTASGGEQFPELSIKFFGSAYFNGEGGNNGKTSNSTQVYKIGDFGPAAAPPQRPVPDGFVRIKGGTFTMGSSSEAKRQEDEAQHRVTVSGFYMGQYEVTQAEYETVTGNNPSRFKGAQLPVENVSWFDAVKYCNARSLKEGLTQAYTINGENITWNRNANGYRLPTEAEWEYACRAGTTTPFNTGNNITTGQANYDGSYPYNGKAKGIDRERTTNVGSFASNAFGLYDMHGNVNEWCWDWYGGYSMADQTDPSGAASGERRVFRGGGWHDDSQYLRSAYRSDYTPSNRYYSLGFRLVRP